MTLPHMVLEWVVTSAGFPLLSKIFFPAFSLTFPEFFVHFPDLKNLDNNCAWHSFLVKFFNPIFNLNNTKFFHTKKYKKPIKIVLCHYFSNH